MKTADAVRGEVWMADLDPVRGHEQAGKRPVLVISADVMNTGPAELVIVVPITSKGKGIPTHVAVQPPEGGLTAGSFVIGEQIRCIAKQRLTRKMGELAPKTIASVEMVLRAVLDLSA